MTSHQIPEELPPIEEKGWSISVPPAHECRVGNLPWPIVVKSPEPADRLSADQKSWEAVAILYRRFPEDTWKEEERFKDEQHGLGPFGEFQRLKMLGICTRRAGEYIIDVLISLKDRRTGHLIRHAIARSYIFKAFAVYDNVNSGITSAGWHEVRNYYHNPRDPDFPDSFLIIEIESDSD